MNDPRSPEFVASLLGSRIDAATMERLMPLVYERAREIAVQVLVGDRAKQWVDASSLVQRTMVRLLGQEQVDLADAARLSGVLATIMRRIVVDIARRETSNKRGGGVPPISLHAMRAPGPYNDPERSVGALELDDALDALAKVDPAAARVAEMRLWGGMDLLAASSALGQTYASTRTLWNFAKAWLAHQLAGEGA